MRSRLLSAACAPVFSLLVFFIPAQIKAASVWTTIDHPGATSWTDVWGIDGEGRLVGNFVDASGWAPYIYDGSTWTSPDVPGTFIGADKNSYIGNYFPAGERGFIYDGSNWADVVFPGAPNTEIYDVDGDQIVGKYYSGSDASHGFLFDGTSWATVDAPGATKTVVTGVDGNILAGNFLDALGWHSFLFDGTTWSTIDSPSGSTNVWGVQGTTVVGFSDNRGFIYDGESWTFVDAPDAAWTQVTGIEGNTVFGKYQDKSSVIHGFTYTISAIPLPPALYLFSSGLLGLVGIARKKTTR